ncbi:MAG TPA: hypothetical protein VFB65_16550, partial [Pyrinomonadaceae bacterium]|nr:hypothetical protein [Pyrinomonadaceae bacterium]
TVFVECIYGTVYCGCGLPDSRGSYGPKSELWTRMYHFYALNRAEFLQHYHKRSNVETTFHMIKSKFG